MKIFKISAKESNKNSKIDKFTKFCVESKSVKIKKKIQQFN